MRELRSSAIAALSGVLVSLTATLAHAGAEPASPAKVDETKEEAKAPEPPAPAARQSPAERSGIRALIEQETLKTDLPADIAEAVVFVESSYDASTIGRVGEIGLMQVRPGTAAMLGFIGSTAELAKPEVNIHYGVIYLSQAWRLAGSLPGLDEISCGSWRGGHVSALGHVLQSCALASGRNGLTLQRARTMAGRCGEEPLENGSSRDSRDDQHAVGS